MDDSNDGAETGAETRKSPSKKARTSLVEGLKNDIQTIKNFIMNGNKPSQVCSPVTGSSTVNLTKDKDSDQATETSTQTSVSSELAPPLQVQAAGDLVQSHLADAAYNITGKSANFSSNPSHNFLIVPLLLPLKVDPLTSMCLQRSSLKFGPTNTLICLRWSLGMTSRTILIAFRRDRGVTHSIKRVAKKVTLNTVEEWNAAFSIFMYIYCSKYSAAAPALVKYVEHIRKMASRGQDWKFYDKHFRLGQQTEYIPWDYVNWEAMNEAQYRTQSFRGFGYSYPKQANSVAADSNTVPSGYCRKYHSTEGCSKNPCRYKHVCFMCSEMHSARFCRRSTVSNDTPGTSHTR